MVSIRLLNKPDSPVVKPLDGSLSSSIRGGKGSFQKVFFAVEMLNSFIDKQFDINKEFFGIVLDTQLIDKDEFAKRVPNPKHLKVGSASQYYLTYVDVPFYTGVLPGIEMADIFFLKSNKKLFNEGTLTPEKKNKYNLISRKITMYPIFYSRSNDGEPRHGGICSVSFIDKNNMFYGKYHSMQRDQFIGDSVASKFRPPAKKTP